MSKLLLLFFIATSFTLSAQEKFSINFDYNKYEITAAARAKLDSFLNSKDMGSILSIELDGHCDYVGNDSYNDQLSLNRVAATKDYLTSKGVPADIFDLEGFGKRKPLNANATDQQRFYNRRVELTITRRQEIPPVELQRVPEPVKKPEPAAPKKEQSLTKQITDSATKEGSNIIVRNMNFIGGRHVLLPSSVPVLEELLEVLKANPKLEIEIHGHICCTPGSEDGMDIDTRTTNLSVMRAMAVYEYLVGHGINKRRLAFKGFGHQYPLVYPEDTEEKRTTNRRVEIKIIKK